MASALNAKREALAQNNAKQAALKAEGRKLLALAEPTTEQKARLEAIDTDLDALAEGAVGLTKDVARLEKYAENDRREGQAVAAQSLEVGQNRAEGKKVTFGEFLQGLAYMMAPEFAFQAGYVMSDAIKAVLMAGPSGASSGVAADGGVLVRNEWSTALLAKARESSQLLGKCDNYPIGAGNDGIEAPYINETSRATGSRWGGVQVYRRAEADTVTAAKPGVGLFECRLEDLMGIAYATERVLRDATLLQAIFENAFASEFSFRIDDEILRGTGAGQMLGVINADCKVQQAKETAQTADTVKAENVIKMFARMRPRNAGNAQWYINQECIPELIKMSVAVGTAGGQLVYLPPGGLSSAPYGTLLGRPVNVLEQCSGLGDEGDIIFADFSEYVVISKAMEAADSMHVRFLYNERTFRWVYPINGRPKLASAITPYKATTATTLSPFVTLQAR